MLNFFKHGIVVAAVIGLGGCGGGADNTPPNAATYSIGGSLTGLGLGKQVTLKNNASEALVVSSGTTFAFPTKLATGAAYAVTVDTQPADQTCTVSSGTGTVSTTGVTTVLLTCADSGMVTTLALPTGSTAFGITVDKTGDIFFADMVDATIRKITAGVVTTIAGSSGATGTTDGPGAAARFSNPADIALDSSGNLFVAEYSGGIRKITSAGVVTTLVANKGSGGVAVDSSGNVYFAETAFNRIGKISSAGIVTILAGGGGSGTDGSGNANGTGSNASFYFPTGVAVDSSGNVYVADFFNHLIRKITPVGVVTTLAGGGGSGPDGSGSANGTGIAASFSGPQGVAVDSAGNVYVADRGNQLIRKITATGVVTTVAGSGTVGSTDNTGTAASFDYPSKIAVDSSGYIYVSDGMTTGSSRIRKISP